MFVCVAVFVVSFINTPFPAARIQKLENLVDELNATMAILAGAIVNLQTPSQLATYGPNIVVNGDFESGTGNAPTLDAGALGSNSPNSAYSGWVWKALTLAAQFDGSYTTSISAGTLVGRDRYNGGPASLVGVQYAHIPYSCNNNRGGLQQSITGFENGMRYQLDFLATGYGANRDSNNAQQARVMVVEEENSVGTTWLLQTFEPTGCIGSGCPDNAASNWQSFTYTFDAQVPAASPARCPVRARACVQVT